MPRPWPLRIVTHVLIANSTPLAVLQACKPCVQRRVSRDVAILLLLRLYRCAHAAVCQFKKLLKKKDSLLFRWVSTLPINKVVAPLDIPGYCSRNLKLMYQLLRLIWF